MPNVYLLHFEPAYRHARHYIGYTAGETVEARLARHLSGRGANLVRVALAAGSAVTLTRVWNDAPRKFELSLKVQGQASRFCPTCSASRRWAAG